MRRLSGIGTRLTSRNASGAPSRSSPRPATRTACARSTSWASRWSSPCSPAGSASCSSAWSWASRAIGSSSPSAASCIGFFAPDYWLSRRIKARQKAILLAIPDTLDLLTISVKAGLGFDAALGKVVEKTKGPLTDEFRRTLAEVRIGKARRDSLREMVGAHQRAGPHQLHQRHHPGRAARRGHRPVLEVQSEQLRIERRQRAEEMAAKAPIKMLFPLVGCIFPSMFIVILGPAIILIVTNLGGVTDSGMTGRGRLTPAGHAGSRDGAIVCRPPAVGRVVQPALHGPHGAGVAGRRRRSLPAHLQHPHVLHALRHRRALRDRPAGGWSAPRRGHARAPAAVARPRAARPGRPGCRRAAGRHAARPRRPGRRRGRLRAKRGRSAGASAA